MVRNRDGWIAVALLVIAGLWYLPTIDLATFEGDGVPGPGFAPRVLIAAIALLSLLLLAGSLRRRAAAAPGDGGEKGGGAPADRAPDEFPAALLVLGGLLAYTWLLERTGFLLTTAAGLTGVLVWQLGRARWKQAVIGAALITGGVWFVFDFLLQTSLPAGRLF